MKYASKLWLCIGFKFFSIAKKKNMMDNLSSSMMDRTTSQVSPKTNSSMYYIQEYLQTTYLLYYSVSTLVFSVYYYVINAFPCRCQMDCKITKMRHGNGLLMIFFFFKPMIYIFFTLNIDSLYHYGHAALN